MNQTVWNDLKKNFLAVSAVPRKSGEEKQISEFMIDFGKRLGLYVKTDSVGNVFLRKPASEGYKAASPVLLQAHMDMVCVQEKGGTHDFLRDGIKVTEADGYLKAEKTSLGADNGIGLACCMTLLEDKSLLHPPLEVLFTTGEETGMTGSMSLTSDTFPIRAKRMINLDTAWDHIMIVGSAWSGTMVYEKKLEYRPRKTENWYDITVHGLKSGHSGTEIHLGRGNAILILAELLCALSDICEIADFRCDFADNVIPSRASASVGTGCPRELTRRIKALEEKMKNRYADADPQLGITILGKKDIPENVMDEDKARELLHFLAGLPSGVLERQPGVVLERSGDEEKQWFLELTSICSSANPASVRIESGKLSARCLYRSMKPDLFLEKIGKSEKRRAGSLGFDSFMTNRTPAWMPGKSKALRQLLAEVYEAQNGFRPDFVSIPATLECGRLVDRLNLTEAVSIGPVIEGYHTVRERLDISSAVRVYCVLRTAIQRMNT